jgi:hypothetical protein
MLKWKELGGAVVYPFEPAHVGDIVRWMRRYSQRGERVGRWAIQAVPPVYLLLHRRDMRIRSTMSDG